MREGAPVTILYRTLDPGSNRLAGHDAWLLQAMMGAVGSIVTVLGVVMLARSIRGTRLAKRLQQSGVSTTGTVVELYARNLTVNNVRLWRLHYEYADFQGRRYKNTVDMPEDLAQEWKPGDAGAVRYDSAQPGLAVWSGRDDPGTAHPRNESGETGV